MNEHVSLPHQRFYWGVLDASSLPKKSVQQLEYLFEHVLPCPLSSVQATFTPLGKSLYLGCALPLDVLDESITPHALSLTPAELPPLVDATIPTKKLNLLVRGYLPPRIRRLRRMTVGLFSFMLLFVAVTLILRIESRSRNNVNLAQAYRAESAEIYEAIVGKTLLGSPLPAALRLKAELRELGQTRGESHRPAEAIRDASETLGSIFALWPDIESRTESIHITDRSVHIHTLVSSSAEAQRFSEPFTKLAGWERLQPPVHATQDGVRTSIQLKRRDGESR